MSDNQRKVMLAFDITDLPMIADALAIARNTALMCGHRGAMKRLEELRRMVEELVPSAARIFDGEVWAEIGIAIREASAWSVQIERDERRPWNREGRVLVSIDGKTWRSETEHHPEDEKVAAVRNLIADLSPLDAAAAPAGDEPGADAMRR